MYFMVAISSFILVFQTLEAKEPPMLEGYLAYNDEKLKAIYVPIEFVEKYKIARAWDKYADIIQGH